jgi:hypothetical protein
VPVPKLNPALRQQLDKLQPVSAKGSFITDVEMEQKPIRAAWQPSQESLG